MPVRSLSAGSHPEMRVEKDVCAWTHECAITDDHKKLISVESMTDNK